MTQAVAILLATACSGLLAGANTLTFLAAAVSAAAASWLWRFPALPHAHDLYVTLDPHAPDGTHLLEAIREALALIRQTRRPVRLRITTITRFAQPTFRIDLNGDGDLELSWNNRRIALKQPGVWLPDHPLPLTLPNTHSITLRLEPCGTERIRASLARGSAARMSYPWPVIALGIVVACVIDTAWLLAAILGFAAQPHLLQYQAHRTPDNP